MALPNEKLGIDFILELFDTDWSFNIQESVRSLPSSHHFT